MAAENIIQGYDSIYYLIISKNFSEQKKKLSRERKSQRFGISQNLYIFLNNLIKPTLKFSAATICD